MAARIVFMNDQDTMAREPEDEVVPAIRRDHPSPVKLGRLDGLVYVNWSHIASVGPQPEPNAIG